MKGQSRGHFHCLQTFLFLFFWLFEAAWHVAFACVQRRRVRFLVPGYLPCRILVVSPKLECHGHPRDRRREGLGSVNPCVPTQHVLLLLCSFRGHLLGRKLYKWTRVCRATKIPMFLRRRNPHSLRWMRPWQLYFWRSHLRFHSLEEDYTVS